MAAVLPPNSPTLFSGFVAGFGGGAKDGRRLDSFLSQDPRRDSSLVAKNQTTDSNAVNHTSVND